MFLALVGERPRPARTSKNLLAGGTGKVHLHNKSTQGLEIPMAVSDARNADDRIAVGVSGPKRRKCKITRGDLTPLELFLAGVRGWKACLQQLIGRLADGK